MILKKQTTQKTIYTEKSPGGHQDLAGHLLLPRPIRPLRGSGGECRAEPR